MFAAKLTQGVPRPTKPLDCGIPLDTQYFDDARIVRIPAAGASAVLARIELPAQYCGVLEYFSQFTDLSVREPDEVETPELRWQILADKQPLYPYHQLGLILNPWGNGSFQFNIRLPEGAVVEMIVKRIGEVSASPGKEIKTVGGRLMGRYWYSAAYGN